MFRVCSENRYLSKKKRYWFYGELNYCFAHLSLYDRTTTKCFVYLLFKEIYYPLRVQYCNQDKYLRLSLTLSSLNLIGPAISWPMYSVFLDRLLLFPFQQDQWIKSLIMYVVPKLITTVKNSSHNCNDGSSKLERLHDLSCTSIYQFSGTPDLHCEWNNLMVS